MDGDGPSSQRVSLIEVRHWLDRVSAALLVLRVLKQCNVWCV